MTDENGINDNQDAELILDEEVPENFNKLQEFFDEIKENPKKYTDKEIVDKLFVLSRIVFDECWNAQLIQTAEQLFNQLGIGFTLLTRILLARHGVSIAPANMIEQPPVEVPSNLIISA